MGSTDTGMASDLQEREIVILRRLYFIKVLIKLSHRCKMHS